MHYLSLVQVAFKREIAFVNSSICAVCSSKRCGGEGFAGNDCLLHCTATSNQLSLFDLEILKLSSTARKHCPAVEGIRYGGFQARAEAVQSLGQSCGNVCKVVEDIFGVSYVCFAS